MMRTSLTAPPDLTMMESNSESIVSEKTLESVSFIPAHPPMPDRIPIPSDASAFPICLVTSLRGPYIHSRSERVVSS